VNPRTAPQQSDALPPIGLQGKRVLVTAGAGFIGARVVRRALADGAHLTVLCRAGGRRDRITALRGVEARDADILDAERVAYAIREMQPDLLIHAAGLPDWRREPSLTPAMVQLHALGTANVLEAARIAGTGRVVVVGSAGEYGEHEGPLAEGLVARPIDPYSVSKLAATEISLAYHRAFGLACTVVRPFVVYGPGEPDNRLLSTVFARSLSGGGPVSFTKGEQLRDFVYVDDVAEGILRAAISPAAAGRIVNIGTGVATSVRDAVTLAIGVAGGVVEPRFGGLPYRTGETPSLVASTEVLREVLGWMPDTTLEVGLRRAYATFAEGYRE